MRRIGRIGRFGYADSIRKTLIRVFAVLIIVPILLLGSYSYIVARNNLIEQTKIAMIGNVDVISHGIENGVKKENDVVKFFSYEDEFRKALERVKNDPYTLTEELNDEIVIQEVKNDEIKQVYELEDAENDAYIERVAREEFDYSKQGERVFINIAGE